MATINYKVLEAAYKDGILKVSSNGKLIFRNPKPYWHPSLILCHQILKIVASASQGVTIEIVAVKLDISFNTAACYLRFLADMGLVYSIKVRTQYTNALTLKVYFILKSN
jgi:hypothetical protein